MPVGRLARRLVGRRSMHAGVLRRQELLRATSRISPSAPFAACCLCRFEASALSRVQPWWPRMPELEAQCRLPVPPAGGQLTSGSSRKVTQTEVERPTQLHSCTLAPMSQKKVSLVPNALQASAGGCASHTRRLTLHSSGPTRAGRATLVVHFPLRAACPCGPLNSNVRRRQALEL